MKDGLIPTIGARIFCSGVKRFGVGEV